MTLLMLTTFQRHALETITCLNHYHKWKDVELHLDGKLQLVDDSIMGCIMTNMMKILSVVSPEHLAMNLHIYPGMAMIWDSPPSVICNRACQNLHLGSIHISYSAWEYGPGEMPEAAQTAAAGRSSILQVPQVVMTSGSMGAPFVPLSHAVLGHQINTVISLGSLKFWGVGSLDKGSL
ncbi:hypothetical protein CPB84DRAFT_1755783 [Gymnopilus junonius]|uniref:Uncharacterized protein n=1 Tax=Gymnopilus junonius TaxID=109634 RepID=A0A9P5TEG4_GYMJU|nr:hypothetical protein CPB84DRAFT_1755783 [Gymnopilus junonius]